MKGSLRTLPEKFFYLSPRSVKAWLDLCRDTRYKNFNRSREVLKKNVAAIARRIDARRISVVSLCSGQGDKDRILLRALKKSDKQTSYFAVDTSAPLLRMALKGAKELKIRARGLKVDIFEARVFPYLKKISPDQRLFLLLGNTLGGFDPIRLARRAGRFFKSGDLLLVDGELFDGRETLAGYDQPANRRFVWATLKSLGMDRSDGDLRFEIRKDPRRRGLFFVRKFFVPFRKGKILEMSPSYKYSPNCFRRLIRKEAGLTPMTQFTSGDGKLLMILAQR